MRGRRRVLSVGSQWHIDAQNPPLLTTIKQFDVQNRAWLQAPFLDVSWVQTPSLAPIYIGSQIYCSTVASQLSHAAPGTPAIGIARTGGHAVFVTNGSNDVSFENVTLLASPVEGFAFFFGGHGMRASGCRVARKDSDPLRLISTNADAVNFRSTRGDSILENGDFGYQGDDGLNVLGALNPVLSVLATDDLIVSQHFQGVFSPGDVIEVTDSDTYAPIGSSTIAATHPDGGLETYVQLATAIPALSAYMNQSNPPLFAVLPASASPHFIIRGNAFHDNREHAMLIATRTGLVTSNLSTNDDGMLLHAQDENFFEGPGAADVVVSNNTFTHDAFDSAAGSLVCEGQMHASMMVFGGIAAQASGATISTNAPNHDLKLENNTFNGGPGLALFVASATKRHGDRQPGRLVECADLRRIGVHGAPGDSWPPLDVRDGLDERVVLGEST